MPVVELDAASLDQPLSLSSSETSASTNSSGSSDERNHNMLHSRSPTYSSSASSYSESSSNERDDESDESVGSSKNSFKLLDKIKQTSNKLNMKFLRRGRKKDVNTWERKLSGNISEIHKLGDNTITTLTETFSSHDLSEMERSNQVIKEPISFESKDAIDPGYYDVDEQYDEYEWAVAVPKGFKRTESSDTGLNAQIALTSPSASRVTEMMARFGADKSPMISPRANSDYSSDFEEDGSRDVSLIDEQSRFDGSESDIDNDSEVASVISNETIEDYSDLDALAALAGAVYQIGSCNFKGILDGYDDDSICSEDLNANDRHRRGRSTAPRTLQSDLNFVQQSKNFFGFTDVSTKDASSQSGNKSLLQSMFSSYVPN